LELGLNDILIARIAIRMPNQRWVRVSELCVWVASLGVLTELLVLLGDLGLVSTWPKLKRGVVVWQTCFVYHDDQWRDGTLIAEQERCEFCRGEKEK
jgi:hypothetical protein